MSNSKIRWSKVYESSEEELIEFLKSRKLEAQRVEAEEFSTQMQQTSDVDFTIWCAEGSLTVKQAAQTKSIQPGDAIHMSANTPYDLLAGMTGYVCYTTR